MKHLDTFSTVFSARAPAALIVLAASLALLGCRTAPPGPPLSETDILQLSSEGFSPEVLGLTARHSGIDFSMSADEILRLHQQGLPPESMAAVLGATADRRDEVEGRRASIVNGIGRFAGTAGRIAVGFF